MSHTTTVTTQFTNKDMIKVACDKVQARLYTDLTEVELFAGKVKADTSVHLRDWRYPLAIDTKTGKMSYDDYNGHWGDVKQVEGFKQHYAEAVVMQDEKVQELVGAGWTTERELLPDGNLKIRLLEPQF